MRHLRFLHGSSVVTAGLAVQGAYVPGQESTRRFPWLWLILILVLIAVVIWWLLRRPKRESEANLPVAPRIPDAVAKPAMPAAPAMPAPSAAVAAMPAPEAAPEVSFPEADMPAVSMPEVEMPEVAMPEVEMPEVAMPAVSEPGLGLAEAETPIAVAPAAVAPLLAATVPAGAGDDLTRIEGVGPKVSSVLHEAGVTSFAALAAADAGDLRRILRGAGLRLSDPASWPEQARLAAAGDWEGLEQLQAQLVAGRYVTADDLTLVEGIGPKVASILNQNGIINFRQLAEADVSHLEHVLRSAGLQMMNPGTWPEQARLAAVADYDGLEALQERLKGGRRS